MRPHTLKNDGNVSYILPPDPVGEALAKAAVAGLDHVVIIGVKDGEVALIELTDESCERNLMHLSKLSKALIEEG